MSRGELQQYCLIFLDSSTPCCRLKGTPQYHSTGYVSQDHREICLTDKESYVEEGSEITAGLMKAMTEIFPKCGRRICIVHYYGNFAKKYPVPDNITNFVKSFNGKIERFRHKPIMVLLEAILHKFMSIIAKRAEIAKEWTGRVVPKNLHSYAYLVYLYCTTSN
ncbi:hypothetical protein Cgig2_024195 [Carnegiea gigantea]|uniref:Uncharacterized protein n=1 Tax=Carnegiea gigantea TaxID=171969 RepID=A0A9Q1KIF5_9CARY|nr:hypothetical protein Cgig2_024195 [Carnegiea gigantea]